MQIVRSVMRGTGFFVPQFIRSTSIALSIRGLGNRLILSAPYGSSPFPYHRFKKLHSIPLQLWRLGCRPCCLQTFLGKSVSQGSGRAYSNGQSYVNDIFPFEGRFGRSAERHPSPRLVASIKSQVDAMLEKLPLDVTGMKVLGDEAFEAGDTELALSILEQAVRYCEYSEGAHYHLGIMYGALGFTSQAIEQLELAKKLTEELLDYAPTAGAIERVQKQLDHISMKLREVKDKVRLKDVN